MKGGMMGGGREAEEREGGGIKGEPAAEVPRGLLLWTWKHKEEGLGWACLRRGS